MAPRLTTHQTMPIVAIQTYGATAARTNAFAHLHLFESEADISAIRAPASSVGGVRGAREQDEYARGHDRAHG